MRVSEILDAKGSAVVTTEAGSSVARLSQVLVEHNVGAAVAVDDLGHVLGVISERDVLRGLAAHGDRVLAMRVDELMTRAVVFCAPDDSAPVLLATMTSRRIRHLPVLRDGRLAGIISIGDLVKSRLEESEIEASALRDYITAR